ncbi:tetratricopeptide repeat protein [Methanobrevibacter sp.]|uniref:tetratricopeptide repeat protein n=1 Tax=Methanobrevibacter sp. TaxID=66852 RepID=UPI0038665C97
MYEEIIREIKSNLGENKDLNRRYLTGQLDLYRDHPYSIEITREISRMIWDCLSQDEKKQFAEISEKENPLMDILNEISPDIESGKYKSALETLDKFIETYPPMFEDDSVSEYHFFTNTLEEILFNEYIGSKKSIRYIPDNQPLLDLYYIYGFLLLEDEQLDKSEIYLKKALRINPVSARIILELSEIYKIHTYTLNKFFIFTSNALKYSYYPSDVARCYRNLGYYYIEENQMETALALFKYSMNYEMSPLAYAEITYIQTKNPDLELTFEECEEIIKNKNIQPGVNPFIIETLEKLGSEYEKNLLFNQAGYYYKLLYGITKDEKTIEKINSLKEKINY